MGRLFEIKKTAKIKHFEFSTECIPDDPELEQIFPAGAENNPDFIQKNKSSILFREGPWSYEEKYDGERLLLHFKKGYVRATTRRQSKKTGLMNEKTNNIPHIRALYDERLEGTVIDGEIIYLGANDTLGLTQSIMNSHPEKSIELQKQNGWVTFKAFDCLKLKGFDVREEPLIERRKKLIEVLNMLFVKVPRCTDFVQLSSIDLGCNYESAFEEIVARGGEGVVLKNLGSAYGENHSWLKIKKEEFVDAFVTGWEKGQGRNSDVCGYLRFSVWNEDHTEMIEIARVGALSDDVRRRVAENFEEFKGNVAELKMQEVTNGYRLRHPRINRWRPDKGESECSIQQLKTLQKSSD